MKLISWWHHSKESSYDKVTAFFVFRLLMVVVCVSPYASPYASHFASHFASHSANRSANRTLKICCVTRKKYSCTPLI